MYKFLLEVCLFLRLFKVEYKVVEVLELNSVLVRFTMSYDFAKKRPYSLKFRVLDEKSISFEDYTEVLKLCEQLKKDYKISFTNGTTLTMYLFGLPSYSIENLKMVYESSYEFNRSYCHKYFYKYISKFREEMAILYSLSDLK